MLRLGLGMFYDLDILDIVAPLHIYMVYTEGNLIASLLPTGRAQAVAPPAPPNTRSPGNIWTTKPDDSHHLSRKYMGELNENKTKRNGSLP